ncbi:unnamed protein product [Arabis nemorensis]|uniref:F-box domain-containing protein n=1 Tax=Arabis nemorensis TaxID=586526 RepID=A0A565BWW9_9BRAS|nr:unnamed protein product [Arabis nemorensis]
MEEKKRRGVKHNIPLDIVEEIMLKLPVKSLVRFKAVSREWRGAMESKCFEEKHMRYKKSLQGGQASYVEIPLEKKGQINLQNLLLTSNGILQYASLYPPIMHLPPYYGFKISASCDGLFCLYNIYTRVFHLVNPATTSHRILPDLISEVVVSGHVRHSLVAGIGRENSVSPRYKLVCYFNDDNKKDNESTRCKVFALDSNTWRYVDGPPVGRVHYDHPMMHLDGVIYSFSYYLENNHFEQDHKVLAFDLHTETFQTFPITPAIEFTYINCICMCVLNHRICIFKRHVCYQSDLFYKLWGLDINKRTWDIMYSINVSCIPSKVRGWTIAPIATINNYVIFSNSYCFIWGHSGSKNKDDFIINRTSSPSPYFMSYVETLVSAYQ